MIYLDNAATTMKKPSVVYKTYFDAVRYGSANAGRGGHRYALAASEKIAQAQQSAAELFGVAVPEQIAFTQNTTMALNMAIHGLCTPEDHVVITGMEHNSVLRPVVHTGCNYTVAPADLTGYVSAESIANAMQKNTRLVVVNHISNVCGRMQPIADIARVVHAGGACLLVDAAQSAGVADIDVVRDGVDLLAFAGHKGLMGPLGTGGLYVAPHIQLRPVLQGGSGSASELMHQPTVMPDLLVSGTANAPAIFALGRAIQYVLSLGRGALLEHECMLAQAFCARMREMDGIHLYAAPMESGVVSINMDSFSPVEVGYRLEHNYGICVRSGLHCAPLAHRSLGTFPAGTVRFSFGYFNTMRDVKKAADAVFHLQKDV